MIIKDTFSIDDPYKTNVIFVQRETDGEKNTNAWVLLKDKPTTDITKADFFGATYCQENRNKDTYDPKTNTSELDTIWYFYFPENETFSENVKNKLEDPKGLAESCASTMCDLNYMQNPENHCVLVYQVGTFDPPSGEMPTGFSTKKGFFAVTLVIPKNYSFYEFGIFLIYLSCVNCFLTYTSDMSPQVNVSLLADMLKNTDDYVSQFDTFDGSVESSNIHWFN